MAKRPLEFEPGTDFRYGYSIDILGRYIEAITGQTLDVVMRDRVLDPLGMDDTEFWARVPDARARAAVVYTKTKEGKLQPVLTQDQMMVKPSRMMGGQGLISTSADYAKFCKMLLNKGEVEGSRVLKTETVELMFENHLKDIDKVYGLGGTVDGKGQYSWGGAAGTKFWIDSERNAYGVFMIQTWGYEAPTYGIFRKLANQIIAE
jgi:CubicO group peptidase (beta-lactamase class C family)